jgi:hypothetical protein
LSTTTDSPISGRSSATTFCIITHCSLLAPGGVSQMMDQPPCVERRRGLLGNGGRRHPRHMSAAMIGNERRNSVFMLFSLRIGRIYRDGAREKPPSAVKSNRLGQTGPLRGMSRAHSSAELSQNKARRATPQVARKNAAHL